MMLMMMMMLRWTADPATSSSQMVGPLNRELVVGQNKESYKTRNF